MRRGHLLAVFAGCGFGPGASLDATLPIPDGGISEMHSFSLADLKTGQLADMTAEASRVDPSQAVLTPNAYTYGGLVAHGLQGVNLWSHDDTSWSKLDGKTASGAGLWTGEELPNGVRTDYLGVLGDHTMTLWLEGEVWLDASTDMIRVNGDAVGFLDLAPQGTTAFARVAENATAAVSMTTAGWYPIRVGFSNNDGVFNFTFTHNNGGGMQVPWSRDRLRARTSELSGMLRTVFGHQILGGGQGGSPPVPHFEQRDLLTNTTWSPPPQGAGNDDWSARYLGQLYVEQAGTYTLRITSDDGARIRLGAGRGEAHWGHNDGVGVLDAETPVAATLVAGWNDVTVDYNQFSGGRRLQIQIQGPDFPDSVPVPRDRLRPVEPADDRIAIGLDVLTGNNNIQNGGGAGNAVAATMTVVSLPGEIVDAIEVTYEVNSSRWAALRADLEPPGGTRIPLPAPGALDNREHFAGEVIPKNAAAPLSTLLNRSTIGDWRLRLYDAGGVTGGSSSFESARLTLHTKGGPDKIARSATWTSKPLDLTTSLVAIESITWAERTPADATVQVTFRACQQVDCGENPKWSDPITSGASAAAAIPGRYLQLRVEMTSNGTLEPEVRSLAVAYRRSL